MIIPHFDVAAVAFPLWCVLSIFMGHALLVYRVDHENATGTLGYLSIVKTVETPDTFEACGSTPGIRDVGFMNL